MNFTKRIGIHGVGLYLPDEVRGNEWWSAATKARWQGRSTRAFQHEASALHLTSSATDVLKAIASLADDPFKGARERRVAPPTMMSSDMESLAARDALRRSGVPADRIGVLLVHSTTPDHLNTPNACKVHRDLALPQRCLAMSTDGMCNAFQQQLTLAAKLLDGTDGYALLVQSCRLAPFISAEDPISAWFGDGAAAVVCGPVSDGFGVLAAAHFTDGSRYDGLVVGRPDGRWYDGGRLEAYVSDKTVAQQVLVGVADHASHAVGDVLAQIGARPQDVDFYASHQGTVWLRQVTQRSAGLSRARSVDTFPYLASLSGANIPAVLAVGERERQLRAGDLVVLFSGGSGETWSATALRWGTG